MRPRFLTYSTALGVQKMATAISTGERTVRLGANPVGINVKYIQAVMKQPSIQERITEMQAQVAGRKVILNVGRLDYVKGPLEKVLAFEQFLIEYPAFHGKVALIQICTPPAKGNEYL